MRWRNVCSYVFAAVRCIEEIFRTQRKLCDLLRPSLELLPAQTSVDTGHHAAQCQDHRMRRSLKTRDTVGHRADPVNTESAQLASHQLKQLTSTCSAFVNVALPAWLNGLVVSALGIRTRGPGFDSRVAPPFHWVATLCKLFTHITSQFLSSNKLGYKKEFLAPKWLW